MTVEQLMAMGAEANRAFANRQMTVHVSESEAPADAKMAAIRIGEPQPDGRALLSWKPAEQLTQAFLAGIALANCCKDWDEFWLLANPGAGCTCIYQGPLRLVAQYDIQHDCTAAMIHILGRASAAKSLDPNAQVGAE